jgi:hypothetical protein
MKKNGIL